MSQSNTYRTGSSRQPGQSSTREHDPDRDPRDDSTRLANEDRRRHTPFTSAIVAAIGAWVALSVFVLDVGQASLVNNILVGTVIFLAAGYNYYRVRNDVPLSAGVSALLALLGIWLIVAAVVFGMLGALFWSTAISGLLVTGLAGYNAYEAREARTVAGDVDARTR